MCLVILALLAQPLMLFADNQTVRGDWSAVRSIATGTKVSVSTKDGRTFEGKLAAVSDASISVEHNGKPDSIARADVKKVYRSDSGSMAKSIAIWAGIGAGAGAGTGVAVLGATGGSDDTAGVLAPFIAVGAGIGAAVGAAIGHGKRKLVYEVK